MWEIPLGMALGGGILGYLKNQEDEKIEAEDRRIAQETMRYSPWTGMKPGQIREANLANNMMQGGMGMGMMGLNVGQMMQGNDLMKAQQNYYQSQTPSYAGYYQQGMA